MPTYTVKSGDTKTKLKQQFGINFDDKQFRSTDPNKLFAGEVISYGTPAPQKPAPAPKVDLSQIKEGVQTYAEPKTNLRDVSVAFSGKADDATMQDIAARNPELAASAAEARNGAPSQTFTPLDFTTLNPEEQLNRDAQTVQEEIATLEERIANTETRRNEGYSDAGIFDDMKTLNSLKDELRQAEDRDIEIPVEARQKLRGRMATKTEFNQETRPELEKNLLCSLAASRNVSRLSDTIKTNLAIVDSEIDAQTKQDEFLYGKKVERLNKITSVYGDIMTEKQKEAAAEKKFQYDLILEGVKSDNTLRGDLIKDLVKRGITTDGMMNMTVDQLLGLQGETTSPTDWSNWSLEEAAVRLDEDTFKNKFVPMFDRRKTMTEEEQAAVNQGIAVQESAKNTVKLLESMLNDEQGLKTSVGVGPFSRIDANFFGLGTESTQFRANAKQLLSQATLDKLLELKAAGGTLGAISEKELDILANAATALGAQFDKNGKATGKFEFKEDEFKTALETMRGASMKTFIAASIGKDAYARAGYQNLDVTDAEDFQTIQNKYNDVLKNPTVQNYAEEEVNPQGYLETALDVIRQEEGLRTEAYQDITGKWTIGFGNTMINGRPVQPGDRLSESQAETLMRSSVVNNYTNFAEKVSGSISPNQFAALTSFEYNLGPGVWQQPTGQKILALVNSGQYTQAGQLMQQYNKARNPQTGQLETNRVLAQRRAREANLLLT